MKTKQDISVLSLEKYAVLELNDKNISDVYGGSSDLIESIIRATTYGTWIDFL